MMSTQMSWPRWAENVVDLADALRALYPDVRFEIERAGDYIWLHVVGMSAVRVLEIPLATTAIGSLAIDELRKRLGLVQPTASTPLSAHPVTRALRDALEEQRSSLGTVQKALVAFEDLLKSTPDKASGE